MAAQQVDSKALQTYRDRAAELASLRKYVGENLGQKDLQHAKQGLETLQLRTRELDDLRQTLGPAGAFLVKYGVVVINDHAVSLLIPKGSSRMDVIEEANALVEDRPLVSDHRLLFWRDDPTFTEPFSQSQRISIDGHHQDARVGEIAMVEDVIVGFTAHWIASGKPLLGWFGKSKKVTNTAYAQKGFSVWYGSNRGLEYSHGAHTCNSVAANISV